MAQRRDAHWRRVRGTCEGTARALARVTGGGPAAMGWRRAGQSAVSVSCAEEGDTRRLRWWCASAVTPTRRSLRSPSNPRSPQVRDCGQEEPLFLAVVAASGTQCRRWDSCRLYCNSAIHAACTRQTLAVLSESSSKVGGGPLLWCCAVRAKPGATRIAVRQTNSTTHPPSTAAALSARFLHLTKHLLSRLDHPPRRFARAPAVVDGLHISGRPAHAARRLHCAPVHSSASLGPHYPSAQHFRNQPASACPTLSLTFPQRSRSPLRSNAEVPLTRSLPEEVRLDPRAFVGASGLDSSTSTPA